MAENERREIETTPAGIAGGQGRTPEEVETSALAAGVTALGLVLLGLIATILYLVRGCL